MAFPQNPMKRARLYRCLVVALGLALAASCASVAPDSEQDGPLIAIDGHFEDWEAVPIAAHDPADPIAVLCDFRQVRATSDADTVYFDVQLQNRHLIRVSAGTIGIVIDADGDQATGWTEHGVAGVDLVIHGHTRGGSFTQNDRLIEIRVWPPDATAPPTAERITLGQMGLKSAPAFESDRVEISVPRGVSIPMSDMSLLTGNRARVKIISVLSNGTLVDEIGPFSLELAVFAPRKTVDSKHDPLARHSTTRLRVLEWNVSHRTLVDRIELIGRILSAIHPDILLLNEVSDDFPSESVRRTLVRSGILADSDLGRVVYGRGGGEERAVVAGNLALTELPGLTDLKYPILDLRRFLPQSLAQPEFMEEVDQGIQVAGAVATIDGGQILLVSFGLESRGSRPFEIEEYVRRIQSMTISSAMARANFEQSVDKVIVAGDFNLVLTEQPLNTVARKTGTGSEPLRVVNALQLDGRTNATWANPDLPFIAGRLDFMLYSARALELDQSFVFDSRDLSPRWLRHHGLNEGISSDASDHFPIVADFSW
jgi:hypothetical protein